MIIPRFHFTATTPYVMAYDHTGNYRVKTPVQVGDELEWKKNGVRGTYRCRVLDTKMTTGAAQQRWKFKVEVLHHWCADPGDFDRSPAGDGDYSKAIWISTGIARVFTKNADAFWTPRGFGSIGTGGNCTAWFKELDGFSLPLEGAIATGLKLHVLVTDHDNQAPDSAAASCGIGLYVEEHGQHFAYSDQPNSYSALQWLLSELFVLALKEWLTPAQWMEMRQKNAKLAAAGEYHTCASHDYCDANMAMEQACRALNIHHTEDPAAQAQALDLVNAAWTQAKHLHLMAGHGE